ncbi:MAG: hypothetical protein JNL05_03610, partial [Flavobacteriales bacterium]|nr:hypothetical protein [Flavobacteriales bacterium]
MNNPWLKTLVFSLLFGAVGFLLGRHCGHGCGRDRGHCEKAAGCQGESACEHGGGCCTEGGKCDMAECDHAGAMAGAGMGGACCKGHGMGHGGGHGEKACCKGMGHGAAEAEAQAAVDRIKASGFQGDTTVKITGGHVNIGLHGDDVKVMIEL